MRSKRCTAPIGDQKSTSHSRKHPERAPQCSHVIIRRMARLAAAPWSTALLLLLAAAAATADPTALATRLLEATTNPEGCGRLGAPCCVARGGAPTCRGAGLACLATEAAQDLRCRSCGGWLEPPCNGLRCDGGLAAFEGDLPFPICLESSRNPPGLERAAAAVERGRAGCGLGRGAAGGDDAACAQRRSNAIGQRRMGACDGPGDCERGACAGGVCVPCGGPGQACCDGPRAPCRDKGPGAVACEFSAAAGGNVCVSTQA
ncbi:MAG: hypothetical protein J3K34DRAFT_117327 [Monoraphidium minutum]|nr:MAG: hypothetical protein J3K34DRAFT_117327 [Monoraphidium minutum]